MVQRVLTLNLFEGADGSQTLVDEIPGVTWSVSGNVEIDTAQSKFGNSSLLIPQGGTDTAEATGWVSPHAVTSIWEWDGYVRWDTAFSVGTSWEARLLKTDGTEAVLIYLQGDGDFFIELNNGGFGTGGANVAPISINTWYHWAVKRLTTTTIGLYWDDVLVFTAGWGVTHPLEKVFLINETNNSNVWFDNVRLIGPGPEVVDPLEFDYEAGENGGPVTIEQIVAPGSTVFSDRDNPDECRRFVVVACDRRIIPKHACRLVVAKPTTLH